MHKDFAEKKVGIGDFDETPLATATSERPK
jgi:hypothetical protein